MTVRAAVHAVADMEGLNFLLTNRLPRRAATRLMGWLSKIEQPLVRDASIALWRFFCDVDLSDAADERFRSLHAAFTRALRAGARPVDSRPDILASPCDAIVGACGRVEAGMLHQIKGYTYRLDELVDADDAAPFLHGTYVTLRLTAGMYHRFHAPADLTVERVGYRSGDTWNVNPVALKRVERLYCRNERAAIRARLADGRPLLLVPVAAILVAGIRLHCLDVPGLLREGGPRRVGLCASIPRGEEMGWFEHGSTIVMFAPPDAALCGGIAEGARVRAGQALMRLGPPKVTAMRSTLSFDREVSADDDQQGEERRGSIQSSSDAAGRQ